MPVNVKGFQHCAYNSFAYARLTTHFLPNGLSDTNFHVGLLLNRSLPVKWALQLYAAYPTLERSNHDEYEKLATK